MVVTFVYVSFSDVLFAQVPPLESETVTCTSWLTQKELSLGSTVQLVPLQVAGVHVYVYGPLPPLTFADQVTASLDIDGHVGAAALRVRLTVSGVRTSPVPDAVPLQPAAVTVTVPV